MQSVLRVQQENAPNIEEWYRKQQAGMIYLLDDQVKSSSACCSHKIPNDLTQQWVELMRVESERQTHHPAIFQPPRSESILVVGDLETLYLEEIDVSDSHDYNAWKNSTDCNSSAEAPVGQEKNDADESTQSRQASFPRTFRIFPPQNVSLPSEGSERSPAVPIYEQQTGALDTTD